MVLSSQVIGELVAPGLLIGDEIRALRPERPAPRVACAPILLCPAHALATLRPMQTDLPACAGQSGVA